MPPPLVAVAHGSRDPRSAATVSELLALTRLTRPDLDIRAAFLDLSAPRLTDVLAGLRGEVVVVPLLLGRAYHARVDLPALIAEATTRNPRLSVSIADVLGPDPRLEQIALTRLASTGAPLDDPTLGVVLAAAGSSHPSANAAITAITRRWATHYPWAAATPAFAAAASPDIPTAIRRLRSRGARHIAVASWFLAPGRLPDRITTQTLTTAPTAHIAPPLGPTPALTSLILTRYHQALTHIPTPQYA